MSLLERVWEVWTTQNRKAGESCSIKKISIGVQEANEVLHMAAECFPDCPYQFGFDAFYSFLRINSGQLEIVCEPTWLGIQFEDLKSEGIKQLEKDVLVKLEENLKRYGSQT